MQPEQKLLQDIRQTFLHVGNVSKDTLKLLSDAIRVLLENQRSLYEINHKLTKAYQKAAVVSGQTPPNAKALNEAMDKVSKEIYTHQHAQTQKKQDKPADETPNAKRPFGRKR